MRSLLIVAVLAVTIVLPGCSRRETTPENAVVSVDEADSVAAPATFMNRVWVVAESERITPADAASLPDLTGIWTVIGHHIPGISAMSDVEATAWHGRTVSLAASRATSSDGRRCDAPSYVARSVEGARVWSEYRLQPGAIEPLADREHLMVLDVHCEGFRWAAMGSRLIGIGADRALTPWDGVFFELARDHEAFEGLP